MPKYEVNLASPVDDAQYRLVSVEADTADVARQRAEQAERDIVNFSLLPPARDIWEDPAGARGNPGDGTVDLARWDAYDQGFARHAAGLSYPEAVASANRRLSSLASQIDVSGKGKVRGSRLSARAVARVLAHRQDEPYAVTDVREVSVAEIDAQRAVTQLAHLRQDPEAWKRVLDGLRERGIPLAAVTAALYGPPWQKQVDGSSVTVYSSATVQCSLHTAYTADLDAHDFYNDASASEVTGTGYTANGVTLASKTSTFDSATDQVRLDAADASWAASTISATDAVIWVNTAGASSTDPVWGNVDFGGTVSTTAGTFAIAWDATGIVVIDIT